MGLWNPHAEHHDLAWWSDTRRIGLWLFIASEAVIFIALLYVRYFTAGINRPEELNQVLGLAITGILLLSSFTANRGEVLVGQGDRKGFVRCIAATILLGLIFLGVVVAVEWPEAMHFAPPSTTFGTVFFVITGMHAFHVLTGLIILGFVLRAGSAGAYEEDIFGVQAGVTYWHFVDVVWVFVYMALYLVGP